MKQKVFAVWRGYQLQADRKSVDAAAGHRDSRNANKTPETLKHLAPGQV
jgi:hypothetical protein